MTERSTSLHAASTIIERLLNEKHDIATIPFFSWSVNCLRVLTQIAKRPCSHAELRQRLEMHRTTLRRKLNQLEDHHWIEAIPAENRYRISPAGQIVIKGVASLLKSLQTASRLGVFQAQLPHEIPLGMDVMDSCEITLRQHRDPYAPATEFLDAIRNTRVLRAMLPTINPHYSDVFIEQAIDGGRSELISITSTFEMLQTRCPTMFDEEHQLSYMNLFVCDKLRSFGVCLCDETIVITVYDEYMSIKAVVTVPYSCHEVVDWAEQRYESCKRDADVWV